MGPHLPSQRQHDATHEGSSARLGARELRSPEQRSPWRSPMTRPTDCLSPSTGSPPGLSASRNTPWVSAASGRQPGGGLSTDGSLICLRHSESGDILHFGLRILTAHDGRLVADRVDPGLTIKVAGWSPNKGDQRVAIIHERDGVERPAIWHVLTDELIDVHLDLPGPVDVVDWWPDGSALLLQHNHDGTKPAYRWQIASQELSLVVDPEGFVSGAAVRSIGESVVSR